MQASKPKNRQNLMFLKRYLTTLARYAFLAVLGIIIAGWQRIEATEQHQGEGPWGLHIWKRENEDRDPVLNKDGEIEHDDSKEMEVTAGNDETPGGPPSDNTPQKDVPTLPIAAQGRNIVIELPYSGDRTACNTLLKGSQPSALKQGILDGLILFGILMTLFHATLFPCGDASSFRKWLYNFGEGVLCTPLGWTCGFLFYAFFIKESSDELPQKDIEGVISRYFFGIGYALCCVVLVATIWDGSHLLIQKRRKGNLLPYRMGHWLPSGLLYTLCYLFVTYMGYAPGDKWLYSKPHPGGGLSIGGGYPVFFYRGEIALAILAILLVIAISPPPQTASWKATIATTSYGLLTLRGVVLVAAVARWGKALWVMWYGSPVSIGSVTFLIINLWWWQALYPYLAALFLAHCHWLLSAGIRLLYYGLVIALGVSLLPHWELARIVQVEPAALFILGGFSLYLLFSIVDILDWAGLPISAMWPAGRRKQALSHRRGKGTSSAKTSYGNESQQAGGRSYLGGLFNFSKEGQENPEGGSEVVTSSPLASSRPLHGLVALLLLLLLLIVILLRRWMGKKS